MTSDPRGTTVLENAHLRVEVAHERGAEIRHVGRPGGPNALAYYDWQTPVPSTPGHSYGASEADWLSHYRGGWQETLPNAGSETSWAGVPLGFHGDGSVLPWDVDASGDDAVFTVRLRLPLVVERRMRLHPDRPALIVETTVRNEAPVEVPFLWGHHPCFPAVDGTRLELPATRFVVEPLEAGDLEPGSSGDWPLARTPGGAVVDVSVAPESATMRCLYLFGHDAGWATLRQPAGLPSVALAWDLDAYPATWVWQMREEPNFPWYGRMRVVAIEPQRAWPYDGLPGAVERGQAVILAGGATVSSWFTLALPDVADDAVITGVARDGAITTEE